MNRLFLYEIGFEFNFIIAGKKILWELFFTYLHKKLKLFIVTVKKSGFT